MVITDRPAAAGEPDKVAAPASCTSIGNEHEAAAITIGITERDLRHDAEQDRLDSAMMKCQGWAPSCADMGMCHQSGRCFSHAPCAFRRTSAAPFLGNRSSRIH